MLAEERDFFTESIRTSDLDGLTTIKKKFLARLNRLIGVRWLDEDTMLAANLFHRHVFSRVVELSIEFLEQEGRRLPSVPFAFVLFGSGGRGEIGKSSDQDHGIIYGTESQADPETDNYFKRLFGLATERLEQLGYPLCEGNVLAVNRRWRLSLGEWKKMVDEWFGDMSWENVRYFTIAADMNCLFGDGALVHELRSYFIHKIKDCPLMIERLYDNAQGKQVPLGMLGQILTERYGDKAGTFSVKQGLYLPIVKSVRILALKEGITVPSTVQRIFELNEQKIWSEDNGQEILFLLYKVLTLRNGMPERFRMTIPDYIKISSISKTEITELKQMLKQARDLQQMCGSIIRSRSRQKAIHDQERSEGG